MVINRLSDKLVRNIEKTKRNYLSGIKVCIWILILVLPIYWSSRISKVELVTVYLTSTVFLIFTVFGIHLITSYSDLKGIKNIVLRASIKNKVIHIDYIQIGISSFFVPQKLTKSFKLDEVSLFKFVLNDAYINLSIGKNRFKFSRSCFKKILDHLVIPPLEPASSYGGHV